MLLVKAYIFTADPSSFPDNSTTTTPVMEAVKIKCPYMILLLESYGADLTRTDNIGRNALHHAALGNDMASCIILVGKNCPLDKRDDFGFTPLVLAIKRGNLEMVRYLVKSGAAVYPDNVPLHSMPLIAATYFANIDILSFLLSVPETNERRKDMQMNYALCLAVHISREPLVELLISEEAPLCRWNAGDISPLDFAILDDMHEMASLLLAGGVNVNERDHFGYTPLMH
ncbi:unnamed protein product, partial [Rodentolepis nana]|uniref:ANK_REP_REGION domain-containing protein n=1 Tax=Rodentolepis nana TaxID=102285 RepID=A0A0R3TIB4_RODNA